MSTNDALAGVLHEMSRMIELLGEDQFRANAHARASRAVSSLSEDVRSLVKEKERLLAVDGIGKKMADKIEEYVATGRIGEHEELRSRVPAGLLDVMSIPGLGPKTVRAMWTTLGIEDIPGLRKAIDDGSLVTLPRMGEKAVAKIKESLALASQGDERVALGLAAPLAWVIVERLRAHKHVARAEAAGSLRRGKETVGDLDFVVALKKGSEKHASEIGELVSSMAGVSNVIAGGPTRTSMRIALAPGSKRTIQVDVRVVPLACFGAALLYFTGSKDHSIALRTHAQKRGLTLNEWGLFEEKAWRKYHATREAHDDDLSDVPDSLAGAEENDVYRALELVPIPPEVREAQREFDVKKTPRLVEVGDIRCELHAHTNASDGVLSLEQLIREAARRGFHTIAVTDHSQSSTIANGLKPDRLRRHIEAIREANETLGKKLKIRVLAGSEVDILADGRLDYDDELLAMLDIVVASPHAALSQDGTLATKRLVRAASHPLVHILGHPTGRLINRRKGLDPDMGEVIAAAKEHGTALEINAHWMRLDLRDTHVRAAVDAGCDITIDCDVHALEDFDNLAFGVATGRRGWLTPERCVNTWDAAAVAKWLKTKRP
ncbi:MAG TPA: DNA polymerase/3'-5' exonuclease PolX [Phycisphaerales bacterium]|nr:DNA polymerase/3'-5' exonuclease PolX [Phycisphaerales bacterium]